MKPLVADYKELLGKIQQIIRLASVKSFLTWDTDTYMPPGSVDQRSDQFELMQGIIHAWETDSRIGILLNKIYTNPKYPTLNAMEQRNLYLIKRHYDRQTKLPLLLVKTLAKQKTLSNDIWKRAKGASDFAMFRPSLEKMVDFASQKAQALDPAKDPYDVLLDLYEPGASTQAVSALFNPLKKGLVNLVKRYARNPNEKRSAILERSVPVETQKLLARTLGNFAGLDFNYVRIDETEHPFSIGYYEDLRITTHYHAENFTSGLFALLHEAGHALYEFNLPVQWRWTPMGTSVSLGIHESQSRFLENMIGRSPEFWQYFLPLVKNLVGSALQGVSVKEITQAVNEVKPSKIRIDADEVTYSLHVILRFEIERMLLHGEISVADLPQVWNEKMDEYLGVSINNDAEGVLQDVHWAGASFGYFPTYVLGNLYGGMFLEKLEKAVPTVWEDVARGNYAPARNWLIEHVYHLGNMYDPLDLVQNVTGERVTATPFLKYLERKFNQIA